MNAFGLHLRSVLLKGRLPAPSEAILQEAIAATFTAAGIPFEREVCLSKKDRIDFLCEEGIGIEVKVDGGISDVTRQLHRYAQSERITRLVLVSTRMRLLTIPRELNGKHVEFIHLAGGAF